MCDRQTEFAPVKNANTAKEDTPAIAASMLLKEAGVWLREDPESKPIENLEVSPLVSYEGEGLEWVKDIMKQHPEQFEDGGYLNQNGMVATFKQDDCCCTLF